MSSKVAKFEEYARKQKEKKRIEEEELIELRIENNNLKKELEKYKKKCKELSEIITRKETSIFKII